MSSRILDIYLDIIDIWHLTSGVIEFKYTDVPNDNNGDDDQIDVKQFKQIIFMGLKLIVKEIKN